MAAVSIDSKQFRVDADEFASQCVKLGLTGAGTGRYYLLPAACLFLEENARTKTYPYSMPPASREYRYGADNCPNAKAFLENWVRWSTICAQWQPEHVEICAEIVRRVAERNRK